ncbi:hypothetical protein [Gordonia hankookensis]|uniref:Uncharacterized protein n=1 Tax=Gordonia hankookensis TaxID=589403 RepID=A0ABR7WDJ6_9ACTN|nr:hypothetical protein [Gordonia hankookensis]MBD1320473.1 hypothetical protein [Gordonia hankookensis]
MSRAGTLVGMPNKYVWAAVSVVASLLATAVAVVIVRRSRREPAPVSATVPRVEDLNATSGDSAPAAS